MPIMPKPFTAALPLLELGSPRPSSRMESVTSAGVCASDRNRS
jgi:hypothetical protein